MRHQNGLLPHNANNHLESLTGRHSSNDTSLEFAAVFIIQEDSL